VIRTIHRTKGASALGAQRPGDLGPFGQRPDPGLDEDDGQDEQQPHTQTSARTTDGTATPTSGAANTTTKENP
jgi:hypothetical protein